MNKGIKILMSTALVSCSIISSLSNSFALDSSVKKIIRIDEKIDIYSDDSLKNKIDELEKGNVIVVIDEKKDISTIKYNDKISYINKNSIKEDKSINKSEKDTSNNEYDDDYLISEQDVQTSNEDIAVSSLYTQSRGSSSSSSNSETYPEQLDKEKLNALFTSYYPENSLLQGGFYDALGARLNPANNTVAAPKEIPFGSQVQIMGTGTKLDGKIYTVRDRGGAIKKRGDQYQFDILSSNRTEAYSWGRRTGYVRIVRWGWGK